MRQTPEIPPDCQWAIFLRNHDELTLEMVTDEERDYMYREYARDPRMRINVGIRRRLSPLMESGRRQIELMNALLMSMPGTPIIYYGDEIGMGDNIYLGDRNGVRTPMQWSADRNAGFSEADTAALFSPLIVDPPYGYHTVNVAAQERVPTSLLRWMRRLIAVRQEYKAFGRGTWEALDAANRRVLVFLRRYRDETILCVNNLSRFAQFVELDLRRVQRAWCRSSCGARTASRAIGELPYLLTLGPHNVLWFRLLRSEQAEEVPAVHVNRPTANRRAVERRDRGALERRSARFLATTTLVRRERRSRRRRRASSSVVVMPWGDGALRHRARRRRRVGRRVAHVSGAARRAASPRSRRSGCRRHRARRRRRHGISRLRRACTTPTFRDGLARACGRAQRRRRSAGSRWIDRTPVRARRRRACPSTREPRRRREQSNTSIIIGDRGDSQAFRRLVPGVQSRRRGHALPHDAAGFAQHAGAARRAALRG